MCGYAVECALKACICRRTREFDFYANPADSKDAWSHDFARLIKVADLVDEFAGARQADDQLDINWRSVERNWSPASRYETHDQDEAEQLLVSISDPTHGVLACIKQFW